MHSLRTTVLVGFVGAGALILSGFSGVVYARSHRLAHDGTASELTFRAETLSGMMEFDYGGIEFDVPEEMLRDFKEPASGAYLLITDSAGKVVVRSPSMETRDAGGAVAGTESLPSPGPWRPDMTEITELVDGPWSRPCTVLTRSFTVKAEGTPAKWAERGKTYPPEESRRYFVQVALDSVERDRALADLAIFLAATGALALALTAGAGVLLTRTVLRPIESMTKEAKTLTPEDTSRRLRPDTVVGELHSLAETLNSALDRLGRALTRQREFTSDAGHELRTPVSVLMSNAEHLLRKPRTQDEYREGLLRQHRIARRMKEITENLLSLARTDAETAAIERRPLSLDDLAITVAGDFETLAAEKGVRIECAPEHEVSVRGDARYLSQALANLVSNAVKFTAAGGRVTVSAFAVDGTATLRVTDTGPGIAEEHLERIFDRFYRVDGGRNGEEGAGLGLAIVQWIVEAHDGHLTVTSRPGEGTTFEVTLATHQEPVASGVPAF